MGFSTVRCGKRINADDSEACKLEKAPSAPPYETAALHIK